MLSKKHAPEWMLEGDIQGCFDNISHEWLMENIPIDRVIPSRWLKAGYMEGRQLFPPKQVRHRAELFPRCWQTLHSTGLKHD